MQGQLGYSSASQGWPWRREKGTGNHDVSEAARGVINLGCFSEKGGAEDFMEKLTYATGPDKWVSSPGGK